MFSRQQNGHLIFLAVTIIKQSAEYINHLKNEKYGISPHDMKKYPYPVKHLGHHLNLKRQIGQKLYQIDLTSMIKENMLPTKKICRKI